jgi:hypothetical protein
LKLFNSCIDINSHVYIVLLQEFPERVYEKSFLQSWVKSNNSEPTTGKKLSNKTIFPSIFAKSLLDDYKENIVEKSLKLVHLFVNEKRGYDICIKLLTRCISVNDPIRLQRKADLYSELLNIYLLQQRSIRDLLSMKVNIAQAYLEKGDVTQWTRVLYEVVQALNEDDKLMPIELEEDNDVPMGESQQGETSDHNTSSEDNNTSNEMEEDDKALTDNEKFETLMDNFIGDFLDIIRSTRNIENRSCLVTLAEFYKKRRMVEELQIMHEKVIETRNSVNSQELFNITDSAFFSAIDYYKEGRYANSIRCSELIVDHIEWRESMVQYTTTPVIMENNENQIAVPAMTETINRLKQAIDLDNENIRAYDLLISKYQSIVETTHLSESALFLINHLLTAVRNSKEKVTNKKCRLCIAAPKYELKYFNQLKNQFIGKEEESMLVVKVKASDTYSVQEPVISKSFTLCGFEYRIEIYPHGVTDKENFVACYLKCMPDFVSLLDLNVSFQIMVFDPADGEEVKDSLILVPRTDYVFRVNRGGNDELARKGRNDLIASSEFDKYRSKSDDCMIHITLKLKAGSMAQ